jgi:hypothetical protein
LQSVLARQCGEKKGSGEEEKEVVAAPWARNALPYDVRDIRRLGEKE